MLRDRWEASVDLISLFGTLLLVLFGMSILFGSMFTVSQTERALIERNSQFLRVTGRGLQFKVPFIDGIRRINTQIQQYDVKVETKTKDNVFVTIFVSIQLYVLEDTTDHIRNAYYKLYNPEAQIQSYVANAILGHVPSMDFDEVFTSQIGIADFIKAALDAPMEEFGRGVQKVQVTKITPPDNVREAMDNINAARRDQEAAKAKGEADKIIVVKEAEAQMERDLVRQRHGRAARRHRRRSGQVGRGFQRQAGRHRSYRDFEVCGHHQLLRYAQGSRLEVAHQHPLYESLSRFGGRRLPAADLELDRREWAAEEWRPAGRGRATA